jgi:hypothetical protein
MLSLSKTARLVLLATIPVLATAQAGQMPQPSAAIAPQPNTASVPHDAEQNSAPTVIYAKGQLTVISQNAPLGVVLKLVAAKTGAAVAVAPELQNEPVVAQLGPGTVREVVTRLLDSPRIGYILMGAGNDPDTLLRIAVQSRRSAGRGTMADLQPPPQPVQDDEENKLDENGKLPNGLTPEESKMSQAELQENWKKIRAQKLEAELLQQKQDREKDLAESQNGSQPQTQPQQQLQDPPPQL